MYEATTGSILRVGYGCLCTVGCQSRNRGPGFFMCPRHSNTPCVLVLPPEDSCQEIQNPMELRPVCALLWNGEVANNLEIPLLSGSHVVFFLGTCEGHLKRQSPFSVVSQLSTSSRIKKNQYFVFISIYFSRLKLFILNSVSNILRISCFAPCEAFLVRHLCQVPKILLHISPTHFLNIFSEKRISEQRHCTHPSG